MMRMSGRLSFTSRVAETDSRLVVLVAIVALSLGACGNGPAPQITIAGTLSVVDGRRCEEANHAGGRKLVVEGLDGLPLGVFSAEDHELVTTGGVGNRVWCRSDSPFQIEVPRRQGYVIGAKDFETRSTKLGSYPGGVPVSLPALDESGYAFSLIYSLNGARGQTSADVGGVTRESDASAGCNAALCIE